jgi:hypothetical protein
MAAICSLSIESMSANAIDIATVINKTASGFEGLLGAWMPCNVRCRVFAILNVPIMAERYSQLVLRLWRATEKTVPANRRVG